LLEQAKLHDAILFDAPKIWSCEAESSRIQLLFEAILEDYGVADPGVPEAGTYRARR
jgi:hypothetical protein